MFDVLIKNSKFQRVKQVEFVLFDVLITNSEFHNVVKSVKLLQFHDLIKILEF